MYSEFRYHKNNPLRRPEKSFDRSIVMFYARREGINEEEYRPKDHGSLEQKSPLEQLEKISETHQPALLEGGLLKLYDGTTFPLSDVISRAVSVTKHNYSAMDKASYLILELNKLYDELSKGFNKEMEMALVDYSHVPEHMRPVSLVANAKHRYQMLSEKHDGTLIQTFRPHTKYPLENELLQTAKFLYVNPDGNLLTTFGGAALWEKNKEYFYNKNTPYN
jgi:hypothetical protein